MEIVFQLGLQSHPTEDEKKTLLLAKITRKKTGNKNLNIFLTIFILSRTFRVVKKLKKL